ncbi:MAG: hypothetical protein ACK4KW_09300 [Gemmobacter sp.]
MQGELRAVAIVADSATIISHGSLIGSRNGLRVETRGPASIENSGTISGGTGLVLGGTGQGSSATPER